MSQGCPFRTFYNLSVDILAKQCRRLRFNLGCPNSGQNLIFWDTWDTWWTPLGHPMDTPKTLKKKAPFGAFSLKFVLHNHRPVLRLPPLLAPIFAKPLALNNNANFLEWLNGQDASVKVDRTLNSLWHLKPKLVKKSRVRRVRRELDELRRWF